jgi:hypothetical protein
MVAKITKMNIHFDVFIEHPELQQNMPSEDHTFYQTYLNFVIDRLLPLKSEIDKEENGTGERFTIIYILEQSKGPLDFINYSKELTQKLRTCFTKETFDQLAMDIENNIRKSHN